MAVQIRVRRDTYDNFAAESTILAWGEMAIVTDRDAFVVGDGVSDLTALPLYYFIHENMIQSDPGEPGRPWNNLGVVHISGF